MTITKRAFSGTSADVGEVVKKLNEAVMDVDKGFSAFLGKVKYNRLPKPASLKSLGSKDPEMAKFVEYYEDFYSQITTIVDYGNEALQNMEDAFRGLDEEVIDPSELEEIKTASEKMLRKQLIRLASSNPSIRAEILSILK